MASHSFGRKKSSWMADLATVSGWTRLRVDTDCTDCITSTAYNSIPTLTSSTMQYKHHNSYNFVARLEKNHFEMTTRENKKLCLSKRKIFCVIV